MNAKEKLDADMKRRAIWKKEQEEEARQRERDVHPRHPNDN